MVSGRLLDQGTEYYVSATIICGLGNSWRVKVGSIAASRVYGQPIHASRAVLARLVRAIESELNQ
jgi:hypothetical protein